MPARRETLAWLTLLIMRQGTICLWRLAANVATAATTDSVRRRFYRFFQHVELDGAVMARVVVELLGMLGKPWVLAMDRTNVSDVLTSPLKRERQLRETTIVFGLMLSAIAQGIIAGIGYAFLGLKMPILLALLTTFTALVPFLGTVVVWGPISIWLLLADQKTIGIELFAWGALIVNPTDNILKPLLISGATDIPFTIVLLGVMGGLINFGLVGLFLGPLILAILLAIWRESLEEGSRGAVAVEDGQDG